jgi:hypothetical protein
MFFPSVPFMFLSKHRYNRDRQQQVDKKKNILNPFFSAPLRLCAKHCFCSMPFQSTAVPSGYWCNLLFS